MTKLTYMQTQNAHSHTGIDVSSFLKPKINPESGCHRQEFVTEINFTSNDKT